jgi:branched-chain amino acid transport system ATP-binding protein
MTALLELTELRKRFGGLTAVDGVSFAIGEGEIVGLLGPNGSGKTTVLNMISGALAPSAGAISLRGRRISSLKPHRIARLGVARTFQLVRILPSLTLAENVMAAVAFGYHRHWGASARKLALDRLEAFGLADRADHGAGSLNYIDQKRLELARALASEPTLLLLDEWLAGLNPTELQTGIDLIRGLKDSGITILLVEHIMEAVHALCGRCIVMNTGRVIADGATRAVLRDAAVVEAYLGVGHA